MSESINVDQAFNPELRQAQADLDAYMASRPYKDENGTVHNPDNGQFINSEKYFDAQRNDSYEETNAEASYEDMGMVELARRMADAEMHNDKQTADNVLDALLTKIDAHVDHLADVGEGRNEDGSPRDGADKHAVWLDKMMKVKEDYKEREQLKNARKALADSDQTDEKLINEDPLQQIVEANIAQIQDSQAPAEDKIRALSELKSIAENGADSTNSEGNPRKEVSFSNAFEADEAIKELQSELNSTESEEDNSGDAAQNHSTENEDGTAEMPVVELESAEIQPKNRFKSMLNKARKVMRPISVATRLRSTVDRNKQRANEYFKDEEKGGRRRKIVAGLVIGAGALAGAVILNHKYGVVDVNPFDGDGLDLNPFNNGENTSGFNADQQQAFDSLNPSEQKAMLEAFNNEDFQRYIEWTKDFKEANPVYNGISLADTPRQYDIAMNQAFAEYIRAAEAARDSGLQIPNGTV